MKEYRDYNIILFSGGVKIGEWKGVETQTPMYSDKIKFLFKGRQMVIHGDYILEEVRS